MLLDTVASTPAWFEYLKPILEILIPIIATAVGTFLTILFKKALDHFKEKHGVEVDERMQERIRETILDGIALAEQHGLKAVKLKEDAPDSAKKLKIATNYIYNSLKSQGYGEVPEGQIEEWVEILLARVTEYPEVWEKEALKKADRRIASLGLPRGGAQFFLNGKKPAA